MGSSAGRKLGGSEMKEFVDESQMPPKCAESLQPGMHGDGEWKGHLVVLQLVSVPEISRIVGRRRWWNGGGRTCPEWTMRMSISAVFQFLS